MFAWPIEVAKGSRLFDHIVASTDDAEIASVAKEWGAEVPFMGRAELSDDQASTHTVVFHVVRESQRIYEGLFRVVESTPRTLS